MCKVYCAMWRLCGCVMQLMLYQGYSKVTLRGLYGSTKVRLELRGPEIGRGLEDGQIRVLPTFKQLYRRPGFWSLLRCQEE